FARRSQKTTTCSRIKARRNRHIVLPRECLPTAPTYDLEGRKATVATRFLGGFWRAQATDDGLPTASKDASATPNCVSLRAEARGQFFLQNLGNLLVGLQRAQAGREILPQIVGLLRFVLPQCLIHSRFVVRNCIPQGCLVSLDDPV